MAYTPEPTHEGYTESQSAQLDREFWALFNDLLIFKDTVVGAIPWKAFYVILDGVNGAIDGVPNATLPTLAEGSYNVDRSVNGGAGVVRTSEGVYVFTLRVPQLGGVDILPVMHPSFTINIGAANHIDLTAESVRVLLTDVDVPSGTLELTVQQLEVPPSGKGVWTPYDLRNVSGSTPDRLWANATLSLSGNAGDYPDTP